MAEGGCPGTTQARGGEFLVPGGGTKLEAGDILLVLTEEETFQGTKDQICRADQQDDTG